ncbi:hypothetical protein BH18ACT13_BH18ACT13_18020 [soil metagenome]
MRFPTGAISSPPGLPDATQVARAQLEQLRLGVKSLPNKNLGLQLDSNLRNALAALASDRSRACSELADFSNAVQAQ